MRPLTPDDLVRGQYTGYRNEPDVAKDSDVETLCELRLFIDSWRWEGVPICAPANPGRDGHRGRMRLKPPGRRSIPFLRNTARFAATIAAVGARRRLTQSSLPTAVGIIPVPKKHPEHDVLSAD